MALRIIKTVRDKYQVHGRPFTSRDFYRICKAENITILHTSERFAFMLTILDGDRFIHLPRRLRGRRRLFAMFHELGHHFGQHSGRSLRMAFNATRQTERDEAEADAFAELATGIQRG